MLLQQQICFWLMQTSGLSPVNIRRKLTGENRASWEPRRNPGRITNYTAVQRNHYSYLRQMVLLFLLFDTSWVHMDHWLQSSIDSSTSSTLLIVMDMVIQWTAVGEQRNIQKQWLKDRGKKHKESYISREMLPRDMYEPNPLTRVDKANYSPNTSFRICWVM